MKATFTMQGSWIEIFFLAMLAGFIGLRLYHVLGRRTGHENPVGERIRAPLADAARPSERSQPDPEPLAPLEIPADVAAEVRPGLEAIHRQDHGFSPESFLTGARAAYQTVLESFWDGDERTLRNLVSDEMLQSFRAAIQAREHAGERLENRLVYVDRAQIIGASIAGLMAEITVRFQAEILSVTRDAEGRIIAGDAEHSVEARDLWTFSRHVASEDPAWLLIATDEEG